MEETEHVLESKTEVEKYMENHIEEMALLLDKEVLKALDSERLDHIEILRKQIDDLSSMSPVEYLAKIGITMRSAKSDILTARMARADTNVIEYDKYKPSWRTHGLGYERYVKKDEVANILNGKKP